MNMRFDIMILLCFKNPSCNKSLSLVKKSTPLINLRLFLIISAYNVFYS